MKIGDLRFVVVYDVVVVRDIVEIRDSLVHRRLGIRIGNRDLRFVVIYVVVVVYVSGVGI